MTSIPDVAAGAVVVVIHGLNMKPSVMDELIKVLTENGYGCVRVSLYDDAVTSRTPPLAIASAWADRVELGIDEARKKLPDAPIHVLGFSTGALAAIYLLETRDVARIDKMFLLAPPVALRFIPKLVRLLIPLWRIGLGLPSAAPRSLRQRSWTPCAEYGALMHMHDRVRQLSESDLFGSVSTQVRVDAKDELVRLGGVARWVESNDLADWTVGPIAERDPHERIYRHYRHLIVTRSALGPHGWSALTTSLLRHFAC